MSDTPRQLSRDLGLLHYIGQPCPRHGAALRFVSNKTCVECNRDQQRAISKRRRTATLIKREARRAKQEPKLQEIAQRRDQREYERDYRETAKQARRDARVAAMTARDAKREQQRTEKHERREAEAAAKWDERYFHGDPCPQGHTLRYRKGLIKKCVVCTRAASRKWETRVVEGDKDSVPHAKSRLRARLRAALRGDFKSGSSVRDLGCTIMEFKDYIEMLFTPGMTWDNWSINGWHLDHFTPLAAFDLTDRGQFLKAMHWTNYQPLWAEEHMTKTVQERRK